MTPQIPWIRYVVHYNIIWLSWLLRFRAAIWCWCRAAEARASSLGGGCSLTLRNYPVNSPSTWRCCWGVASHPKLLRQQSSAFPWQSAHRICSLESEYALKGSLALRQLPAMLHLVTECPNPDLTSLSKLVEEHYKAAPRMGTNVSQRKLSQVQEICPIP